MRDTSSAHWVAVPVESETFVGRRFTVMGFLWAIHGHHGIRLGPIDLVLRPLGDMEWHERARVIA